MINSIEIHDFGPYSSLVLIQAHMMCDPFSFNKSGQLILSLASTFPTENTVSIADEKVI
jgi:hypothetical protein